MKLIARKNERHAKVAALTAGALMLLPLMNPISVQAKPAAQAPAWGYRDNADRRPDQREPRVDRGYPRSTEPRTWPGNSGNHGNGNPGNGNHNHDDNCEPGHDGYHGNSGYPGGYNYPTGHPSGYGGGYPSGYNYPGGYGGYGYPTYNTGYNYPGYNGGYNAPVSQRIDFQGTAIRVYGRNRLDVRSDGGQSYAVSSDDNYSTNINDGDRVRVQGVLTGGNSIRADKVKLVADNGYGNGNYGGGSSVNFGGRVDSVRTDGGLLTLSVRGDNGQLYTVRYYSNAYFGVGDRVRIVGNSANGVVNASSVSR